MSAMAEKPAEDGANKADEGSQTAQGPLLTQGSLSPQASQSPQATHAAQLEALGGTAPEHQEEHHIEVHVSGTGGASPGNISAGGASLGGVKHTANAATETSHQFTEVTLGEHLYTTAIQVFIPFMLAGFGSVLAGIVLDLVKNMTVFVMVRELFILIPPLLGLNGNLEQTLVARLSTQANLGNLDRLQDQMPTVFANLALLQCQATIASTVACILAVIKGVFFNEEFQMRNAAILFAGALAAVNLASFILCTVMCIVVLLSRRYGRNPDEVAPAIAASFGDLTTLSLLSLSSSYLYTHRALVPIVIILCYSLLPVWMTLAHRNPMTYEVLRVGWIPILTALVASSFGGYILDYSVVRFPGIALHLSSVNAIGGNIAAIFSCTMSTYLSKSGPLGVLPRNEPICTGPYSAFFSNRNTGTIATVLLCIVIPGQTIIATLLKLLRFGHVMMSPQFLVCYCGASLSQVVILLYLARILVYALWRYKIDPDNAAIPFLTGSGDFLGTGFLTIAFFILEALKDPSVTEGDEAVTAITATTLVPTGGTPKASAGFINSTTVARRIGLLEHGL